MMESPFGTEELTSKLIIPDKDPIPGQYIVVLDERTLPVDFRAPQLPYEAGQQSMREEVLKLLSRHAISTEKLRFVYAHALQGFSLADVSDAELQKLRPIRA